MCNKKLILFCFLAVIVFLGCGCETTKGLAAGVGYTAGGAAEGAVKDTKNFWHGLWKADDWVKKNLW